MRLFYWPSNWAGRQAGRQQLHQIRLSESAEKASGADWLVGPKGCSHIHVAAAYKLFGGRELDPLRLPREMIRVERNFT